MLLHNRSQLPQIIRQQVRASPFEKITLAPRPGRAAHIEIPALCVRQLPDQLRGKRSRLKRLFFSQWAALGFALVFFVDLTPEIEANFFFSRSDPQAQSSGRIKKEFSVEKQEVMTRDNVPVTVDAVLYFRVVDPATAVVKVENFLKATSLIAQTTLRSVLGQAPLDDLLSQRESINLKLQEIIDRQTEPWGVKVTAVEVKDVALPDTMKRAMAKQAEAERERRAKIVNAEGEFQAAEKMVQAASMMSKEPIALQLRFLQTMREIASEHNTTTFLPMPIDLFTPFMNKSGPPKP